MVFGYPDIFKYPSVQYIPLKMYGVKTGSSPFSYSKARFNIYRPEDQNQLNDRLKILKPEIIPYNIRTSNFALLLFNAKVDIIKYRAHEVILVGDLKEKYFTLFQITTKYFYKNRLIFIFYEGKSGERISWRRLNLN